MFCFNTNGYSGYLSAKINHQIKSSLALEYYKENDCLLTNIEDTNEICENNANSNDSVTIKSKSKKESVAINEKLDVTVDEVMTNCYKLISTDHHDYNITSKDNNKYRTLEEQNIIKKEITDSCEITYSEQETCEENESKIKPEGFMEYEVNANGCMKNEEYGGWQMGGDEDESNEKKIFVIEDTNKSGNNNNNSNDDYNITSKSLVIKEELDIEEKEVKNELVDFSDDVSGQVKGNGDVKCEGYGEGRWWMGCDEHESNDKEVFENLLVVASVGKCKDVKKSKRKNTGRNSSKKKKKKSITLLRCWNPVVILEDIRFNKHYFKLVSDQLRKVRNSSKKKKGGASIEHTASTTILHCSYCDYTTYKKFNLREHIDRRHVNETVFLCTYCTYETGIKRFLDSHMKAKHSTVMDVYECSYCSYQAHEKLHLIIHINALHDKTTL